MTKEIAHTRDLLQEIAEDVRGRGEGPHAGPRGGKFHSMHERSLVGTDLSSESWPSRSGGISEPRAAASNGGAPYLRNASTQLPRHQLFIIVNRFVFEDSVQEQIKYRVLLVNLICTRLFRFDRVLSILARLGSCRDVRTILNFYLFILNLKTRVLAFTRSREFRFSSFIVFLLLTVMTLAIPNLFLLLHLDKPHAATSVRKNDELQRDYHG